MADLSRPTDGPKINFSGPGQALRAASDAGHRSIAHLALALALSYYINYDERVLAGEEDYDGVPYADLVFEDLDWSEVGDHDPARRSERKGRGERNVATEWATEACQDPRRWVRSAGSASGLTV